MGSRGVDSARTSNGTNNIVLKVEGSGPTQIYKVSTIIIVYSVTTLVDINSRRDMILRNNWHACIYGYIALQSTPFLQLIK